MKRIRRIMAAVAFLAALVLLTACASRVPEAGSAIGTGDGTSSVTRHSDGGAVSGSSVPAGSGTQTEPTVPPGQEEGTLPTTQPTPAPTTENVTTEVATLPTVKTTRPAETTVRVTTATAADVPMTGLTELPESEYYGRKYLSAQPDGAALVEFYDELAFEVSQFTRQCRVNRLTVEQLSLVFQCYRADYPQYFWLGSGYRYSYSPSNPNAVLGVTLEPFTLADGAELMASRSTFEAAVQEILEGISGSLSEYDRALMIHDRLVRHAVYREGEDAHNAYGVLVRGAGVCEGYAHAYQYLCYRAGIQALFVTGSSRNEAHAWNIVRLDGRYTQIDITWDDPVGVSDPDFVSHAYFGLTDREIAADHTLSNTGSFVVPACTEESLRYHRRQGSYFTAMDAQRLGALLADGNGTAQFAAAVSPETFRTWWNAHAGEVLLWVSGDWGRASWSIVGQEYTLTLIPR